MATIIKRNVSSTLNRLKFSEMRNGQTFAASNENEITETTPVFMKVSSDKYVTFFGTSGVSLGAINSAEVGPDYPILDTIIEVSWPKAGS
jgi:hypothetical protein